MTTKQTKSFSINNAAEQVGALAQAAQGLAEEFQTVVARRDELIKALREAKVVAGKSVKTCEVCQAFLKGFSAGKTLAKSSQANALSAFRAAVNDGKRFDLNASRKTKAAGTKKESSAKKDGGAIVISIKKDSTIQQAAGELRKLAEKLRPIDGLNLLAAMLIDVLDEVSE